MHKSKNNSRIKSVYLWVLFISVILLFAYYLFNIELFPVLKSLAVYKAKNTATEVINNSVQSVLQKDSVSYDSLMIFEKDQDNKIVAIKSDSLKMNKLKVDLTKEILSELSSIDSNKLNIPIGNLFGGVLLANKGPAVKVEISPVGSVYSDIYSVFNSAGINQTHQQVMLKVQVSIMILLSSTYSVSETVNSTMCIADTIIVGNVPNSYFYAENK